MNGVMLRLRFRYSFPFLSPLKVTTLNGGTNTLADVDHDGFGESRGIHRFTEGGRDDLVRGHIETVIARHQGGRCQGR